MKKLLLLAGEESGVLYARQIAAEVTRISPGVEIRGYEEYGFKTPDLAVMGFGAVLKKLFYFLRVKRTMEKAIETWQPEVVCTIDYPGLNLKLAAFAKANGIRAVHVVCPQVWAWKKGRIPKIEAAIDRLFCFFPFEPALFKPGFAEFVGHPLADAMKGLTVARGRRILALLPGSRLNEIERNLPTMLAVADALQGEVSQIVVPAANERAYAYIERNLPDNSRILLHDGGARNLLLKADVALVASGTATLEAALAGCPTVLVYRVGRLFALVARMLIRGIKHIGLANIIAEKAGVECPMPELIQDDFTVENVLKYIRPWLSDPKAAENEQKKLAETMKLLESDGNSIAKIARSLI